MADNDDDHSEWTVLDALEARAASGFVKRGGKHVAHEGLIARSGYKRILPHNEDPGGFVHEYEAKELAALAQEVLHARNASVFQALILDPMQDKPRRSVDDLAEQFGVTPARIHKILYDCKERLRVERDKRREAAAKRAPALTNETCQACGRTYREGDWPRRRKVCEVGGGDLSGGDLNSECLIMKRLVRLDSSLASLSDNEKIAEIKARYARQRPKITEAQAARLWAETWAVIASLGWSLERHTQVEWHVDWLINLDEEFLRRLDRKRPSAAARLDVLFRAHFADPRPPGSLYWPPRRTSEE